VSQLNDLLIQLDDLRRQVYALQRLEHGSGGGAVTSVNGDTGVVVLDADDIDDSATTNKFATAAELTKLAGIETAADVTDAGNVGAVNAAASSKNPPIDADSFPIVDSAASNVIKRVTFTNLKAFLKTYFDTLYSALLGSYSAKNPPVDADSFVITDSAASDVAKRVTGTNLKAYLKTYFDTLYGLLATANTWTANNAFNSTATTGSALSVTRNLTSTSTDAAVVAIVQDHASDDQAALRTQQDGTGDIQQWYDGGALAAAIKDGGVFILGQTGTARAKFDMLTSAIDMSSTVGAVVFTGVDQYGQSLTLQAPTTSYSGKILASFKANGGSGQAMLEGVQFASDAVDYWAVFDKTVAALLVVKEATGRVGIGTSSPQGKMHVHDGTGGWMFVTKTAIDGSAQTIVANGTGDATLGIYFTVLVKPSTGSIAATGNAIANNSSLNIYDSGGNTLNLRVNSDGSVDVRRTAGSLTYTIAIELMWF